MSVYVDPLMEHGGSSTFRWKTSCHMYADTLDELHAMALVVGMKRSWFQDKPSMPHYDLVESRRRDAVRRGAVEHTKREMVAFMQARRAALIEASNGQQGNAPEMQADIEQFMRDKK